MANVHFDGKRFHNLEHDDLKSLWDVLKWKWTSHAEKWPTFVENKNWPLTPLPVDKKAVVTFINHSTVLLQLRGLTVITDPIFSERAGPGRFAGPKRVRAPGIVFEDLPPIDIVLVSHNHYDHLDLETLRRLDAQFHPLFLVPLGNGDFLRQEGLFNVHEMDWWQELSVKNVTFTFTPAQHWSARTPFDKCKTLWGGFMIASSEFKTFFAGDTGMGRHFKDIRENLGAPDLALLPIGAYEPRWFMRAFHLNPKEAVEAHEILSAKESVGIHFGTFQLTDEGINRPVEDLKKALEKKNLNFKVLDQGQSEVF